MSGANPPPDEFEEIFVRCLDEYESKGPTAVEAICSQYPNHASRIRKRISELIAIGVLGTGQGAAPGGFPERLGEFRLIRQLGGGGMGVVYLAEQEKLGREVALKLIRPDMLYFPGAHERFRREFETIARLQHPGIVPIYTVGEENGIPFFAMERVRGVSLDVIVRALHAETAERLTGSSIATAMNAALEITPPPDAPLPEIFRGSYEDACLRIVEQVARALDHAHRQGVVHRDIKPPNVMLTPDGRAMLLDFGLAAREGSHRLTRTGSQLGSLHYMPPEHARGEIHEPNARTDVYSLGVTLYELLTLFTPFSGDSAHEILFRIGQGNPLPPRERNRAISVDAETVCLKAMDVDPPRRYWNAGELASDLSSVVEHHPIRARRAGPILVFTRYCQRRPAIATALVLGTILLTVGPAALYVQERFARKRIENEKAIADKNFNKALEAVDSMLTEVGSEHLRTIPHMEPVRRKLMQQALEFYRGFVAERSDDPSVRRGAARVMQRVGDLESELGDPNASETSYRGALAELDRLGSGPTDLRSLGLDYAKCLRGQATSLISLGKTKDAVERLEAAIARIGGLAGGDSGTIAEKSEYANCLEKLGELQLDLDIKKAERTLRDSIDLYDELAEKEPAVSDHRAKSAHAHQALGVALELQGLPSRMAAPQYAIAVETFGTLAQQHPDEPLWRFNQARALMDLGGATIGRDTDGEAKLKEGVDLERGLVADFPGVSEYARDLVRMQHNYALLIGLDDARLEEARIAHSESVDLGRKLVARFKDDAACADDFANCLDTQASIDRRLKLFPVAIAEGGEAVERRRAELAKRPQAIFLHRDLGTALLGVAYTKREMGDSAGARTLLVEALAEMRIALANNPDDNMVKDLVRGVLFCRANCCVRLGDLEGAIENTSDATKSFPKMPRALRDAATIYAQLASAAQGAEPSKAAEWNAQALRMLDAGIALHFDEFEIIHTDPDFKALLDLPGFAEREAAARR